jgi:hypothetical protein
MRKTLPIVAGCALMLAVCGCETSKRNVTRQQMDSLESSAQSLRIGMSKAQAMETIPAFGYRNLVGSTTAEGGGVIEEWVVSAEWKNDWTMEREWFERYLYFLDSKLVDVSRAPLQYRDRRDLIVEWRNR